MSLTITAVTPIAIVVAADSAMTTVRNGEEIVLTGFPKVVLRKTPVQAFALIGDLRIGRPGVDSWAHLWLGQFLRDLAPPTNLGQTAQELATALNDTDSSDGEGTVFLGAAWEHIVRVQDDGSRNDLGMAPAVWEVSRGRAGGEFSARQLLTDEDQQVMVRALAANEGDGEALFQIRLFHAGIPRGYGAWIIREGRERLATFTGAQLPGPTIEGVEEYVRFAIKLAAELYAVSGMPRYVAEPIHTVILFPETMRPTVLRSTR